MDAQLSLQGAMAVSLPQGSGPAGAGWPLLSIRTLVSPQAALELDFRRPITCLK